MGNRIYAYTVVGKDTEPWERAHGDRLVRGQGLIKVGQTTKGTARARIKQQLGTAYPGLKGVQILLDEPALRTDGSEFSDHDLHAALVSAGIHRIGGEWFEATLDEIKAWQSRPLDEVYPILYIDGLRLRIKDNGVVTTKSHASLC